MIGLERERERERERWKRKFESGQMCILNFLEKEREKNSCQFVLGS